MFLVAVPIVLTFVMLVVNLLRFTRHVHYQEMLIRLVAGRFNKDNADSSEGCKDKLKATAAYIRKITHFMFLLAKRYYLTGGRFALPMTIDSRSKLTKTGVSLFNNISIDLESY